MHFLGLRLPNPLIKPVAARYRQPYDQALIKPTITYYNEASSVLSTLGLDLARDSQATLISLKPKGQLLFEFATSLLLFKLPP